MLPVIHLTRINHHLRSWQCGAAERHGSERGVQSLYDTPHPGITSHNRVIISSLSPSRALPLSLVGITGVWEKGGGGAQSAPIRSKLNTHTYSVYTSSFRSITEKEITRTEMRSGSRFSLLKDTLALCAYSTVIFCGCGGIIDYECEAFWNQEKWWTLPYKQSYTCAAE